MSSILKLVKPYETNSTIAGPNTCKMKVKPSCCTAARLTARTAVQATSSTLQCYVLSNTQALKIDFRIFIFRTSVLYR